MKPTAKPKKRVVYGLIAFFLVAAVGFLVGAGFAWSDEQSGEKGSAHVYHCADSRLMNRADVHCEATWIYKGRPANGWVQNAKMNYAGKTISVRIHGTDHVTVATYWVPIGLAVMGLLVGAMGVWLIFIWRRRMATAAPEPPLGSPASG